MLEAAAVNADIGIRRKSFNSSPLPRLPWGLLSLTGIGNSISTLSLFLNAKKRSTNLVDAKVDELVLGVRSTLQSSL
jgi:hypothetical protein